LMLFVPLQTSAKFLEPPVVPLLTGWELPRDSEAEIIGRIDEVAPGSIPYKMTAEPLAQKVMTIWTTTSNSGKSEVVTFGYGYDPSDLDTSCSFADKYSVSVLALGPQNKAEFVTLC